MRITAKIVDSNPVHSRLSVWVNGGLITNPGGICLRNEEVVEFLDHLKLSSFHIKAKLRSMMEEYKRIGEETDTGMHALEKRIALQIVLGWIEEKETVLEPGYPDDWPRCPGCGEPALDGHITCGDVRCGEGQRRAGG